MGSALSNLLNLFMGKEDVRILMVGLDDAGKTTILYQLKMGEVITPIPTIGFNVETVDYKNLRFTVWDVGRIRKLWYHFYLNISAIIYVVDATDSERLLEAAKELHIIMDSKELENAVLLVLANKQDLAKALNVTEIAKDLELNNIKQEWHIQGTCATSGSGLYEGLEVLRKMLITSKRKKTTRF